MNQQFSIYISGKMSGVEDLNKPKFEAAEILLHYKYGSDTIIINPHKINHDHDKKYTSYMKKDLQALLRCRMVVVLDDWKKSRGAIVEVLLASFCAIPVYCFTNDEYQVGYLKISWSLRVKLMVKLLLNRF